MKLTVHLTSNADNVDLSSSASCSVNMDSTKVGCIEDNSTLLSSMTVFCSVDEGSVRTLELHDDDGSSVFSVSDDCKAGNDNQEKMAMRRQVCLSKT